MSLSILLAVPTQDVTITDDEHQFFLTLSWLFLPPCACKRAETSVSARRGMNPADRLTPLNVLRRILTNSRRASTKSAEEPFLLDGTQSLAPPRLPPLQGAQV